MSPRTCKLISWLCVVSLAAINTMFQGGLVLCADGDGAVRVEWGCGGESDGGCPRSPDAGDAESASSRPCSDSPLETRAPTAGARSKSAAAEVLLRTGDLDLPARRVDDIVAVSPRISPQIAHPLPVRVSLRTIILVI